MFAAGYGSAFQPVTATHPYTVMNLYQVVVHKWIWWQLLSYIGSSCLYTDECILTVNPLSMTLVVFGFSLRSWPTSTTSTAAPYQVCRQVFIIYSGYLCSTDHRSPLKSRSCSLVPVTDCRHSLSLVPCSHSTSGYCARLLNSVLVSGPPPCASIRRWRKGI